ncbi:MAG: hypothetical protein OXS33_04095 [bacterium]|nr:hypothetical protein [bacterium]
MKKMGQNWLVCGAWLGLGSTLTVEPILLSLLPEILVLQAQEIVELPGRDRYIEPDFEEVFHVGVLQGEPWEMFDRVDHVAFDAEGNLFVVDGIIGATSTGDVRILVFDAAGGFQGEFGSPGEGPGEFRRPTGVAVLRDGTTVVSDAGHRAYQLFGRSGVFLRSVRLHGVSVPGSILPDPRGGAVFAGSFRGSLNIRVGIAGGGPVAPQTSRPVLWVRLAGEVVRADTVVHGWLPPRGNLNDLAQHNTPSELREMLGRITLPTIFEPRLLAGVLPNGGIVHADSSAYTLKVTLPGSQQVARIIRRPFLPEAVTPAVQREYEERRAAAQESRGQGGRGGGIRRVEVLGSSGEGVNPSASAGFDVERRYYHEVPVLRDLATTWEGRIWVLRRGDQPESDGPIDVVAVNGEYVGSYRMGATGMPAAFGPAGLAAFIEPDEFDVARVVVRKLPTEVR